jgi:hypothetical protein
MLRKALEVLLVVSWVILSGFDLLEDLDVPIQVGVHSPIEGSLPNLGQRVDLVNNIVESADRTRLIDAELFELPGVDSSVDRALSFKKVFQLHKLHRVYQI